MPRVKGRGAIWGTIAVAAVLAVAPTTATAADAAVPAGPRLAVSAWEASGANALLTTGPAGDSIATVLAVKGRKFPQPDPFAVSSWSPDGARLAFTAVTGQHRDRDSTFSQTAIALVEADGGEVTVLPGTASGFAPVFSPDGTQVAFAKVRSRRRPNQHGGASVVFSSESIWILDLTSGESRQLTPWRNQLLQFPSSFSPDGSRVAFTRVAGKKPPEALAVDLDDSARTVLAHNALEPIYSPDGSQIAFVRGSIKTKTERGGFISARLTDLYTVGAGGGDPVRLTKTKSTSEWAPSWDPSGQRLAFTAVKPFASEASLFGFGDRIREINADGTCSITVLSDPATAFFGSAWQPGAGRGAGPISC
jgi:dipeptidyl aminopeptidase/acylaminoacyl peptidase